MLVDNGVVSASDFTEGASQTQSVAHGLRSINVQVAGFQRVALDSDPDMQLQKDALFSIGRLAREGKVELYTYFELMAEQWRGNKGRDHAGNAFRGCAWNTCKPALERSSYFRGIGMDAVIAKGGRKDRKAGKTELGVSQIAFFKFLISLSREHAEELIKFGQPIVGTDFDRESLRDLDWFRNATSVAPSDENLADFFHLWTARRNSINVFLTLEKKLPRFAAELGTLGLMGTLRVLRPTEFLHSLGLRKLDPVPFRPNRFYSFAELMGSQFRGWNEEL